MNQVFFAIVALSFTFAVVNGTPQVVGDAALAAAKDSVSLALGLIGYITLFLGLMKVVEEAGGLKWMAGLIRPILIRLFPDVPPDHPAMGAMVMNIAANALGLGNAATPFGLKAMSELNKLNPHKGTATNAMVLFLAINTSGLALLPTGIIGLRAQFDSADPAAIFPTTLLATACSTAAGILVAKMLSRMSFFAPPKPDEDFSPPPQQATNDAGSVLPFVTFAMSLVGLVIVVYTLGERASVWIMPVLIFSMLLVGVLARVRIYEAFIKGAKEGFDLGVMIIPYLVAILCAIAMLRASGGLAVIVALFSPLTTLVGLPGEVLPLAILRPLSGSGGFGLTTDLVRTHGPDSYIGNLASTMNGSTETTFYVLAVYFGSVSIQRYRHALFAGLSADIVGVFASVMAVQLLLSGDVDAEISTCEQQRVVFDTEKLVSFAVFSQQPLQQGEPWQTPLTLEKQRYLIQVCAQSKLQLLVVASDGSIVKKTEIMKQPTLHFLPPAAGSYQLVVRPIDEDWWQSTSNIEVLRYLP